MNRGIGAALTVLLLAVGCSKVPTGPNLSASRPSGVPGSIDIMVPCWADSTTAWLVNLPVCKR